jgi:hypothetical protein
MRSLHLERAGKHTALRSRSPLLPFGHPLPQGERRRKPRVLKSGVLFDGKLSLSLHGRGEEKPSVLKSGVLIGGKLSLSLHGRGWPKAGRGCAGAFGIATHFSLERRVPKHVALRSRSPLLPFGHPLPQGERRRKPSILKSGVLALLAPPRKILTATASPTLAPRAGIARKPGLTALLT